MSKVSLDVKHDEVSTVDKVRVHVGEGIFTLALLNQAGHVLEKFTLTEEIGKTLSKLNAGHLIEVLFKCGKRLKFPKH
jgi:hypothetical protein